MTSYQISSAQVNHPLNQPFLMIDKSSVDYVWFRKSLLHFRNVSPTRNFERHHSLVFVGSYLMSATLLVLRDPEVFYVNQPHHCGLPNSARLRATSSTSVLLGVTNFWFLDITWIGALLCPKVIVIPNWLLRSLWFPKKMHLRNNKIINLIYKTSIRVFLFHRYIAFSEPGNNIIIFKLEHQRRINVLKKCWKRSIFRNYYICEHWRSITSLVTVLNTGVVLEKR